MRLGADPEMFLLERGKHVSVIGMIGADKWNPLQLDGLPHGFTIQEDNVAIEFGIPPAASAIELYNHIDLVMEESLKYVYTGLEFSKLSCTVFDKDQMQHPLAFVFGCEPDWCAWTEKENTKPKPPHEHMRSAGGHIHVETDLDPIERVKLMDLYLSVPLVLMDDGFQRKSIYGKAGAFRKKPYGFEYRTPSNWWCAPGGTKEQRQARCEWVWKNTERALTSNINLKELEEVVPKCINENDAGLAQALINHYELEVI